MAEYAKAQQFLASLATNPPQLPFEPALVTELFTSTAEDAMASSEQIASLVNRSQNLAVQVLRLANSAYYGFGSSASSLSAAIRILGTNEIRSMLVSLGAVKAFKNVSDMKDFTLYRTWTHQVLTALFAREMAALWRETIPAWRDISPDELYTAGLLHDLGKVLMVARCPQDWLAIARLAAEQNLPFYQAEDAYWGIDHGAVGGRLLTFWQIPSRLTELVSWHHAPKLAENTYRPGAMLLSAADILANAMVKAPVHASEDPARPAVRPDDRAQAWAEAPMPPEAHAFLPAELDSKLVMQGLAKILAAGTANAMAATLLATR